MRRFARFLKFTITTRLLIAFLAIALLPLAVATYVSSTISSEALRAEVNDKLLTLADDKAQQIENYAVERKHDVTVLARAPEVVSAMIAFDQAFQTGGIDSPDYVALDTQVRPYLTFYIQQSGYILDLRKSHLNGRRSKLLTEIIG